MSQVLRKWPSTMGLNDTWDRYRADKWIVDDLRATKGKGCGIHRMSVLKQEAGNSGTEQWKAAIGT